MANILGLGLRALQFFWTLLILAITGNIIDDAFNGNPSIINYCIFVAVFSMLSLIYLILITMNDSFTFHPVLPLALEALNTLFFLVGGIALAAELGSHSCTNSVSTMDQQKQLPTTGILTKMLLAGLHQIQRRDQRRRQHEKAVPRIASRVRIPLVRLRSLCRLTLLHRAQLTRWRRRSPRRYSRCAINVPGLGERDCSCESLCVEKRWLTVEGAGTV